MKRWDPAYKRTKFLRRVNLFLFLLMLVMVGGFFTWSENVMITRAIKVVGRLGTTVGAWMVYRMILDHGAAASFRLKNSLSATLYGIYLLLGFTSLMWSTNPGYSLLQWFMDVECMVFAWYFMQSVFLLQSWFPESPTRFYSIMGNTAFTLLLVFIIGMIVNPDDFFRLVEGGEDKRLGGYIMNPNELGMLCGLGISCLIFDLYSKPKKWWTIFKILLIGYALILTKSRSSLVGLLIIIFFHVRRSDKKWLQWVIYAGVLGAVPLAVQHLVMRKGGLDDVLSMTGRMPFWKALISEGLPREPLLGFGFMRIDYKETFSSVHSYTAHMTHNTFIQVLMNLGFIGLVLVMFQLFFTLRGFLKEDTEKKLMLFGIFIPVLINSFTEFGIFGESNYAILFYQLLIFSISFGKGKLLSTPERIRLERKRPELFTKQHFTV
jgi:exopolysaccharide production protein ExoQ